MIVGIGTDIVEIEEIGQIMGNSSRFITRVFTNAEIIYCENKANKYQHFAARFAAKESFMKALGYGWDKGLQWNQIEILQNDNGSPYIVLKDSAEKMAKQKEIKNLHLSLSHSGKYAIAIVVLEK